MTRKMLAAILALTILLAVSGCANMADDGSRTRQEGTGAGAVVGAVIGAIVGQVIGGDTTATMIGATVGAALGAGAGYAYGNHVATQKEKFAREEDWLDACIVEAQKKNREVIAYNEELRRQITLFEQDIQLLQKQQVHAQEGATSLKQKKAEVDNLLTAANKELEAAKVELDMQNSVIADVKNNNTGDYAVTLDSEILALQASIKELEKNTAELASMSASMSV